MHEVAGEGGWIAQIPDSEYTFFTPRGEVSTHTTPPPLTHTPVSGIVDAGVLAETQRH
jgi:hypothetical protein